MFFVKGATKTLKSFPVKYKYSNAKSTDAQGILKPKSVIPREEGGLGF